MATKTPVSILMELCVKKNMKVDFVEVSSSGPPNDRVFVMCATVITHTSQTFVGEGVAKTKKDAKQNAAQAVLEKIGGALTPVLKQALPVSSPLQGTSSVLMSISNPVLDLSTQENSVGRLLEFCAQKKYATPVFEFLSRDGESHQPLFTMKASQGEESATASARTKQQAKQDAARFLYEKLSKKHSSGLLSGPLSPLAPAAPVSQPVQKMTQRELDLVIEKYDECKPLSNIPKTNPNLKFGSFHSAMTDLLSPVKDDLSNTTFSKPKETLNAVAKKLDLLVSYHEARNIYESSQNEKLYVYVIVSTQPTTVQIGEGQSTQMAQGHAALTVLRYWQTFLGIFPVM